MNDTTDISTSITTLQSQIDALKNENEVMKHNIEVLVKALGYDIERINVKDILNAKPE